MSNPGQLVTVSSTGGIDLDFTHDGFLRTSATRIGSTMHAIVCTGRNSAVSLTAAAL